MMKRMCLQIVRFLDITETPILISFLFFSSMIPQTSYRHGSLQLTFQEFYLLKRGASRQPNYGSLFRDVRSVSPHLLPQQAATKL
jgi:hypothetical protein